MKQYGLIGFPLGHSFSAGYFAEKFKTERLEGYSYQNFPLESIEELPRMLASHPGLEGFNVTIPYKQAVLPYLNGLSPEAEAIGAVNCVKITAEGPVGHNTDAYGFTRSLLTLIGDARPDSLVLGTGGASKAVTYSLGKLGMRFRLVSRTPGADRLTYEELTPELISRYPLIVNCTPLGTFPNTDTYPALPYEALTAGHYLFDLVYNPPLTEFLRRGKEHGAAVRNGHDMLIGQAEKSWEIWNSER